MYSDGYGHNTTVHTHNMYDDTNFGNNYSDDSLN